MASILKENVRGKILASVEELISAKGVNDFSLNDIATACNISKGTLYYYYKTKDDIVFDVVINHMESLKNEYLEWLNRHQNDLTKERFLSVIFYKGVKLFNRSKIHIYIINECIGGNDILKNKYIELWQDWRQTIKKGIDQVFNNVEDQESLSYLLMIIIDGLVVQEVLGIDDEVYKKSLIALMKKVGD